MQTTTTRQSGHENGSAARALAPAQDDGLHLFCLASSPVRAVCGLPGFGSDLVECIQYKKVTAVVSRVPVTQWLGMAWGPGSTDNGWMASHEKRHAAVLERTMRHAPIYPFTFGGLFLSEAALRRFIDANHVKILQFLRYIENKEEWSLNGVLDVRCFRKQLVSPGQLPRAKGNQKAQSWIKEKEEALLNLLQPYIAMSRVCRTDSESPNGPVAIWNWAILLQRVDSRTLLEMLHTFNAANAEGGLTVAATGPLAPFTFCPSLGSA